MILCTINDIPYKKSKLIIKLAPLLMKKGARAIAMQFFLEEYAYFCSYILCTFEIKSVKIILEKIFIKFENLCHTKL